jgi:hypothetical protein
LSRFKLINNVASLQPKGKGFPRQAIIRQSIAVFGNLKIHSLPNIKVVVTTVVAEGKNNKLADIGADMEFAG